MTKLINMLYVLYYPIINWVIGSLGHWVVFEFFNFDKIIINVVFGLTNIIKYLHIDMTYKQELLP